MHLGINQAGTTITKSKKVCPNCESDNDTGICFLHKSSSLKLLNFYTYNKKERFIWDIVLRGYPEVNDLWFIFLSTDLTLLIPLKNLVEDFTNAVNAQTL